MRQVNSIHEPQISFKKRMKYMISSEWGATTTVGKVFVFFSRLIIVWKSSVERDTFKNLAVLVFR